MIKVALIVIFIIVGLIYDWGGVIGRPGLVSRAVLLVIILV
jgi:amino acid permease